MALRLVKGGSHRTARRGNSGALAFLLVGAGGSVVEALEWETVSADPVPARIGADSEHDPLLRAIGEAVLLARQSRRPSARSIEISLERPYIYAIAAAPIAGKGRGRGEVAVIVSEAPTPQAGRMEGKVIRQLGHDLRTPLTSISGAVELLQSGRLGPMAEQQLRVLGMMQKGVDAMVRLIDEATAPFRQESGIGLGLDELENLARESGGGAGERRGKDRPEEEPRRGPRSDPKRGRR